MIGYTYSFKQDYDKRIKIGGNYVFGYSEKKMREMYPQMGYSVVGETTGAKPKKRKAQGQSKESDKKIGAISVNSVDCDIFILGTHKSLLYGLQGYVCVGENAFVAVYSSRMAFIITLSAILALLITTAVLMINILTSPKPPVVIDPDHPMPDIDPDAEILPPSEDDEKVNSNGGGFVSLVYTKDATVSLAENKATIYYQNPNRSNHSVVLELYIVSDGTEYYLGRTGLIPAGNAIYSMDVSDRDVNIREGIYTGLYRLYYYNPETGERAAISSNVTEIKITVNEN